MWHVFFFTKTQGESSLFWDLKREANAQERDRVGSFTRSVWRLFFFTEWRGECTGAGPSPIFSEVWHVFFSIKGEANAQVRVRFRSFPGSGVYFFSPKPEANAQVRDRVRSFPKCGMYFLSLKRKASPVFSGIWRLFFFTKT